METKPKRRIRWLAVLGRLLRAVLVLAVLLVTAPMWTLGLRMWVFGERAADPAALSADPETLAAIQEVTAGGFSHGISEDTANKAYRSVAENPEAAERVGCYCMCDVGGHQNLRACFFKKVDKDGKVTVNQHGRKCPLCIVEARMIAQQTEEGKTPATIQANIAKRYRGFVGSIVRFTREDLSRYYSEWRNFLGRRPKAESSAEGG